MSAKKRPASRELSATRSRAVNAPAAQLSVIRAELQGVIAKLKALGCEDSMVLVEFWHALDGVNGEDR